MIHATCPKCHRRLQGADTLAGRFIPCPKCTTSVLFPTTATLENIQKADAVQSTPTPELRPAEGDKSDSRASWPTQINTGGGSKRWLDSRDSTNKVDVATFLDHKSSFRMGFNFGCGFWIAGMIAAIVIAIAASFVAAMLYSGGIAALRR